MLKRIITSIVAICVLVPALVFSDTVVFPIMVGGTAVIGLYELIKCFGMVKNLAVSLPLYVIGAAMPFCVRYISDPLTVAWIAFIAASLYGIYLFALIVWSHGKLPFGDTMAVLLMSIYIIAGLSSILFVRDIDHVGRYIYLLIFLGAWMTDIFAYFTGYFFGKHKLIEDVSPKKTIEGSIGGVIFCTLSFIGFGLVMKYCFGGYDVNLWFLGVSGVIISLVSQVGDLIMSVIKRHYGIKDYGKIFPGHGGMLDRFDSILAVSLALCALCMFGQLTGISLLEQIPLA